MRRVRNEWSCRQIYKDKERKRHNRSLYLANNKNLDDDDISHEKEFITLNVCFQMMVFCGGWNAIEATKRDER